MMDFKPERFLASFGSGQDDALQYILFGSGRRCCLGVNLSYIFVGTAIGMMLQCFDWKTKGDKVDMEEAIRGLNLTMAHPLKCIPVARNLNPLACSNLKPCNFEFAKKLLVRGSSAPLCMFPCPSLPV
ncbi:putative cytochrome P450 [Arabidopsis thaliana]